MYFLIAIGVFMFLVAVCVWWCNRRGALRAKHADGAVRVAERLSRVFNQLNNWGALNYSASCGLFIAPNAADASLQEIVRQALQHEVVLHSSGSVTSSEVREIVTAALEYRGDSGSHPNLAYLDSSQFVHDRAAAFEALDALLASASLIAAVHFEEGHPYYPVFWHFAFVMTHGTDGLLLVGSVSD